MKAYEYILSKQIQWAHNHHIELIGSQCERGRPAYTKKLGGSEGQVLTLTLKYFRF